MSGGLCCDPPGDGEGGRASDERDGCLWAGGRLLSRLKVVLGLVRRTRESNRFQRIRVNEIDRRAKESEVLKSMRACVRFMMRNVFCGRLLSPYIRAHRPL